MAVSTHIVRDLQVALKEALVDLDENEIIISGILDGNTLYYLAWILATIRDTIYDLSDTSNESKSCIKIINEVEEKITRDANYKIENKHKPLLRKAIIDILREGYKDLNFNNNVVGFPDNFVYYKNKGETKVVKSIDKTGAEEFDDMWLSGVINIVEIYVAIQLCGGRANYNNFIGKDIIFQGEPYTNPIKSSELVTKYAGFKHPIYGTITLKGPSQLSAFTFNSLGCDFWEQSYARTENDGADAIIRRGEAQIHSQCVENYKLALKTVFMHYAELRNFFPDDLTYTDVIKKIAPGLYRQNGIAREVCSKVNSFHMWCLAIDMDAERNAENWSKPYARLSQPIYNAYIRIMSYYGFKSLGVHENWDWMHFQFSIWNEPAKNQSNDAPNQPS